jgi:transposase
MDNASRAHNPTVTQPPQSEGFVRLMEVGDRAERQRRDWITAYRALGDAGAVCRRFGVSRPTLRKWLRRYEREGEAGLRARSCRPHHSPALKVGETQQALILCLRQERRLGVKRLRNELQRLHELRLSRVQMDTCKIRADLYRFTAIDDCSRFVVAGLARRRSADAALAFLYQVLEEMPFSIQRVQTDRRRRILR